jgi:hypothetical protein
MGALTMDPGRSAEKCGATMYGRKPQIEEL